MPVFHRGSPAEFTTNLLRTRHRGIDVSVLSSPGHFDPAELTTRVTRRLDEVLGDFPDYAAAVHKVQVVNMGAQGQSLMRDAGLRGDITNLGAASGREAEHDILQTMRAHGSERAFGDVGARHHLDPQVVRDYVHNTRVAIDDTVGQHTPGKLVLDMGAIAGLTPGAHSVAAHATNPLDAFSRVLTHETYHGMESLANLRRGQPPRTALPALDALKPGGVSGLVNSAYARTNVHEAFAELGTAARHETLPPHLAGLHDSLVRQLATADRPLRVPGRGLGRAAGPNPQQQMFARKNHNVFAGDEHLAAIGREYGYPASVTTPGRGKFAESEKTKPGKLLPPAGPRPDDDITLYRAGPLRSKPPKKPGEPGFSWMSTDPRLQEQFKEVTGRWWSRDPKYLDLYVEDSPDPAHAQLSQLRVSRAEAEKHLVSNLPADHPAREYSAIQGDEYFLPRDLIDERAEPIDRSVRAEVHQRLNLPPPASPPPGTAAALLTRDLRDTHTYGTHVDTVNGVKIHTYGDVNETQLSEISSRLGDLTNFYGVHPGDIHVRGRGGVLPEELTKNYPELVKEYMRTGQSWALRPDEGRGIVMNLVPPEGLSPDQLMKNPARTLTHEYGHQMQFGLHEQLGYDAGNDLTVRAYAAAMGQPGMTEAGVLADARKRITSYAGTNPEELFAELTAVASDPSHMQAGFAGKVLGDIFQGRPGEVTPIRSVAKPIEKAAEQKVAGEIVSRGGGRLGAGLAVAAAAGVGYEILHHRRRRHARTGQVNQSAQNQYFFGS